MPGHGQFKSALTLYLEQQLAPLKQAQADSEALPSFEEVFGINEPDRTLLTLLTTRVLLLLQRDDAKDSNGRSFWE